MSRTLVVQHVLNLYTRKAIQLLTVAGWEALLLQTLSELQHLSTVAECKDRSQHINLPLAQFV